MDRFAGAAVDRRYVLDLVNREHVVKLTADLARGKASLGNRPKGASEWGNGLERSAPASGAL
jgi:hypothetical protein